MSEELTPPNDGPEPFPNFLEYHKSIANELQSIKNRIRNLARHWATDGEHKEVALRSLLRRHLPDSVFVGRGFIVSERETSTQIDVLIVDKAFPTLFKDGDLVMVTPDAVRAIIEVKTKLTGSHEITEAARKLAKNARLCCDQTGSSRAWTGLFEFETCNIDHNGVLQAIRHAYTQDQNPPISCVALGTDHFFRFFVGRCNINLLKEHPAACYWSSYTLQNLAPSYFLGNLVEDLSPVLPTRGHYAWYPLINGKEAFCTGTLNLAPAAPRSPL